MQLPLLGLCKLYGYWLTLLISEVVSDFSCITFEGHKQNTLNAIRTVLRTRNLHEECVYNFLAKLRDSVDYQVPVEIPCTPFMMFHFHVPRTNEGFVFILFSMGDTTLCTYYVGETEYTLTAYLRRCNSTAMEQSDLYPLQPWTVAFYGGNFPSASARVTFYTLLCQL